MEKRKYNFDRNSDTWMYVKEKMEEIMEKDRKSLERDQTEVQTAKLRGRIDAFRMFLGEIDRTTQPKISA